MELTQLLEEFYLADKYIESIKDDAGTHKYIKALGVRKKLDAQIELILNSMVSKIKLPDEPDY